MPLLEPLTEADAPVYAVMGNHDHAVAAVPELTDALTAAGAVVLSNQAAVVPGLGADGSQELHVVGLGAVWADEVDVDAAPADVPDGAPSVVMRHNPTTFDELPAGTAPIALAGHMHRGQVALPGTPRWSYLGPAQEEAVVADGFAPEGYGADGNAMFVSCGIGFSTVPVRIDAPPQVVLLQLVTTDG